MWFNVNDECCGIVVEDGMLVANEDVWKVAVFSLVI